MKRKKKIIKKKTPRFFVLFIPIVLIVGLIIGNWYLSHPFTLTNSNATPTYYMPNTFPSPTLFPSPSLFPTWDETMVTLSESDLPQVDTSTWKTFHDDTFDFSFLYPPAWTIKTFDDKQGQNGPDLLTCDNLQSYLKDGILCTNTIVNHTITIESPNKGSEPYAFAYMYIYTSAGGGAPKNRQLTITVDGTPSTLTMTHETKDFLIQSGTNPKATEGTYTGFLGTLLPVTGPKSIWKNINFYFGATDTYFPKMIRLLKSIKD